MRKNKQLDFTIDAEIEIICSISPGSKGCGIDNYYGPTPDEPPEVEDLYVSVILSGKRIDITDLLDAKQKDDIEEKCFQECED